MAGMHVRHGDKHVDGFRDHSLTEEVQIISKSRDCMLKSSCDQCFVYASHTPELAVTRAKKLQTVLLTVDQVRRPSVLAHLLQFHALILLAFGLLSLLVMTPGLLL